MVEEYYDKVKVIFDVFFFHHLLGLVYKFKKLQLLETFRFARFLSACESFSHKYI